MAKALLVYYSLTGLNETIAQRIHDKYQIDIFNIQSTVDYP
ncbi:flavodoxin family protein [Companilactobacillus kimchiensis]|nr:flavodoxin family protein [Companilactobacillus kimchiensis]